MKKVANTQHFKEEIHELLDNHLDPKMRLEVEKHLESCEECRKKFNALRWIKQFFHKQCTSESVPAKLKEDILNALDLEDCSPDNKIIFFWAGSESKERS